LKNQEPKVVFVNWLLEFGSWFFLGSGLGPPDATAERYPHSLDK